MKLDRRILLPIIALGLAGTLSAALFPPVVEPHAAPRIDGALTDPAWETALALPLAESALPLQPPIPGTETTLRLLVAGGTLYVGMECRFPADFAPRAEIREHDAPVFEDESVELFIAPDGHDVAEGGYFHFALNAAGSATERQGHDPGWNIDWEHAVSLGTDRWTAELAIPLGALVADGVAEGRYWRLNACRNLYRPDGAFAQGWVLARPGYHAPSELLLSGPVHSARLQATVEAALEEMAPLTTYLRGPVREQHTRLRAFQAELARAPERAVPPAEAAAMLAVALENAGNLENAIILYHMFAEDDAQ